MAFLIEYSSASSCQDDPPAMDFVTAAANLRMHIFSMNMKSRFDVKCKLVSLSLCFSTGLELWYIRVNKRCQVFQEKLISYLTQGF